MKNLFLVAFVLITVLSCKEDKEFNTPSFEATKNNVRWSAQGQTAFFDEVGDFNIKAEIGTEVVLLTVPNREVGTYVIEKDNDPNTADVVQFEATFQDLDGTMYSTENNPDASLTVYPVGGKLLIDEVSIAGSYVTGRFQFSAFSADGLKGITFSGDANRDSDLVRYGIFYRVNTFGTAPAAQVVIDPVACAAAVTQSASAEAAFTVLTNTDPTYTTACNTYKVALQAEIIACGDPIGVIQAKITALGTCM